MKKIKLTESDVENIVKKVIMESDFKFSNLISYVEELYNSGIEDYRQLINKTMDAFYGKVEEEYLKEWVFDAVNKVIDQKRRPIYQQV